ncbi:MAG: peptidylprolyl isomerase [Vicinamibacterales bacterium]
MTRAGILSLVLSLGVATLDAQRPMPSHPPATPPPAGAVQEVALVNGMAVTSDRVAAVLSTLIPQESFHRNVSAEKMTALRRQALSNVIDEELVYQDGVRKKLTPSPAEMKAAWSQTVTRYGGAAQFDAQLKKAGATRASVELELARRIVIDHAMKLGVLDQCRVTADDAELFYRRNPDRFVEPEQIHVHAVTIAVDPSSGPEAWTRAKARAQEARRALDAGTAFAEVARTFSTDAGRDKGGDMGLVHRGGLASPFDAIVANLPVGTPSAIVESIYGYHIVLVSEVKPPQKRTFEQVSATLIADLASTRCTERRDTWLADLRSAARIQMLGAAH